MVSPRRQERLQQQQAIPMVHRGGGAFLTRPTPGKGRGGGGGDGTAGGHRSLTARESSVANAISCSALTSSESSPRVTVRLPVLAGGGGFTVSSRLQIIKTRRYLLRLELDGVRSDFRQTAAFKEAERVSQSTDMPTAPVEPDAPEHSSEEEGDEMKE